MSDIERYVNLSDQDYSTIITEGEMLIDRHIYEFGKLLSRESNYVFNMQDALLVSLPEFITPIDKGQKHIQILFSGCGNSGHWVCSYYDGVRLYIYDSANRGRLNEEEREYLSRLYPFKPAVVFSAVQHQANCECGVFAIAFATSLYFNVMPNILDYVHSEMRKNLYLMFRNNRLIDFRAVKTSNNRHIIIEDNWERLFDNRSEELQCGKSSLSNFSQTLTIHNANKDCSTEHSVIQCSSYEKNEQKRLRALKDKERKRKARLEETIEQKRIRQEKDKQRKRDCQKTESEIKERQEKNLTSKKKKLLLETEVEKKERQEKNLTSKKKKLLLETEVEKKERQKKDLLSKKRKLLLETEVEKKERQEKNLTSKKKKLLSETEVEKKERQEKNLTSKNNKKNSNKSETLGAAIMTFEDVDESKISLNYLGPMNVQCGSCESLNFLGERPQDGEFNSCCKKGKIKLNKLKAYPTELKNLVCNLNKLDNSESTNFKENIRSYNSSVAFASMGAKLEVPRGRGPYVFRVHGQVYHNTYSLHPDDESKRKYGQMYIFDTNKAVQERLNNESNKRCLPSLMFKIDSLLRKINPYAEAFKMMREVELEEEKKAKLLNEPVRNIQMWIKRDRSLNTKTFNVPSCNEVAIVFISEDGEPPVHRDICIHPKGSKSIPISSLSVNADPMIYPLMFPSGDPGWTVNIKQDKSNRNVTPLQFYMHRLSYRGTFNPCLSLGKLTQQYIVDVWSKVEGERLKYIRQQQGKLRAEMYCGLMDYINNKAKNENIRPGKMIILPSTFNGGPRSYQESFMDAMRLVQECGKPDLFITMTCNPKWSEITSNLFKGQTPPDRPDIVARVFNQKVQVLMTELKEKQIFGAVKAHVHVIEFQKRGLPHIHLILFLDKKFAIRDAETVDKIICAEIPDEKKNPRLYDIVKQFQVHGPCGNQNMNSPCMDPEKKVCTKNYPKVFCSETNYDSKIYPLYRRRDNGKQIIFYNNNDDREVKTVADNRFIVPYNPYLSLRFNCHINVEVCSSVECIKYLFKYCYKGHDCAIVGFRDSNQEIQYDEIEHYINTRYVCPPEAIHRLSKFKMHVQSHAIYKLAVHLPNEQVVPFKEGLEQKALDQFKNTTLTAWFQLNKDDKNANQFLYMEIANHYCYDKTLKIWNIREKFQKPVISRMYFVSPKDTERYFLRMLLLHVRGAKSFEDIRTYEGITYNNFLEAARARNLLIDDNEWDNCLAEAVSMKFPKELCRLFAYICVFGLPNNAMDLWNKYKEYMIFDNKIPTEISIHLSLILINEVLTYHGFTLKQFGLPDIDQTILQNYNHVSNENQFLALQLLKRDANILIASLNNHQRQVFDVVMMAVHNNDYSNRYFFLDGPGDSGKSYLHNTIITALESENLVVLSVAWTGIAANLLKGGRTSHSLFKFPIPLNEDSTCNISGMSKQAELLRSAKIIIWDEITMAPKYALQAVDTMLRDITKCVKPFGGKVILLSGDFRQTLPIVRHGSRTHIIEACVKSSVLWKLFVTMSLHINVRLSNDQKDFSNWLLKVGNGRTENLFEKENKVVEIPNELISNGNLIDEIYGSSINPNDTSVYSSCILSLTNVEVLDMNERILSRLEGEKVVYNSIDSHKDEESREINNNVPVEFLNSLTPDGLPPHKLSLKVGCVIMLLRNMNLVQGLCNGTRLVVTSLLKNVISAEIISGKFKGEKVLIPRIDLSPSLEAFPFTMVRRQFPVRLAYAMTINKSQGQSFNKVGICLPNSAFGHGQIYVGCSRVKSKEHLKIHAADSEVLKNLEFPEKMYVKNIVYQEIL